MSHSPLNDSSQDIVLPDDIQSIVPPPPPPLPPPVAVTPVRPRPVTPPAPVAVTPPPPPPVQAHPTQAYSAPAARPTSAARQAPITAAAPAVTPMASQPRPRAQAQAAPQQAARQLAGPAEPQELSASEMARRELQKRMALPWFVKLPGMSWLEPWFIPPELASDDEKSAVAERRREAPSWLVSFILHVVILLGFALIPIAHQVSQGIEVMFGDSMNGDSGGGEFSLSPDAGDVQLESVSMSEITPTVPNLASLTEVAVAPLSNVGRSPDAIASDLSGMAIEQGLSGRSGSLKGSLLGKYGGTAETESAVELGLRWLATHQLSDGGWSLTKSYADPASNDNRTAATAMALNAFLGAGYTHREGKYKDQVSRGLKFLIKKQDKEGFFAAGELDHQKMYAQALATITVCEAYGMTADSELRPHASRAIKFAEWSQGRLKGWRYEPRGDSDLSVTGWFLMALMTGKMAGLEPNQDVIKSVGDYLETVSHDYGSSYSYTRPEKSSLTMTAEGLLCRQYLGWPSSHPSLIKGVEEHLLPNAPEKDPEMISVYYWYYATQVLHHMGGKYWTEWNNKMREVLPAMQRKEGAEAGSWDPELDVHAPSGGRLYVTCFNIYCLEVYYRHLAIYDIKGGKR